MTPRQKRILNILTLSPGLKREEIQQELVFSDTVSKPTLIRDLNRLYEAGLVGVTGQSRDTHYWVVAQHPLLSPIDRASYFARDPDVRLPLPKNFDPSLLTKLGSLFTPDEIRALEAENRSFTEATAKLGHTVMVRELERFVIELSWKSSKIEGNTYSLLETEALIKESQPASGRSPAEAVMILNHKRAFEMILAERDQMKTVNLSMLSQLHNTLVANLNVTTGIRTVAVGVTGTNYRPLDNQWQIQEALVRALEVINEASFALEKALLAVALVAYIQPFADGNKRTGRMLGNALLLANDCFPLSYRSVGEEEYKEALIIFYEQGNLYHLKRLMVDQFRFAQKTYFL